MDVSDAVTVREATPDDHADVREMTANTWPDRGQEDYLGRVYPRWLEAGDRPRHTLVVEADGRVVAIAQSVLVSDHEAWGQGLRVHPEHRDRGYSRRLTAELFDWAREAGAGVMRALVHGWNAAGLGQARATGYRPAATFRWVHPRPGDHGDAAEAVAAQPECDPSASAVRSDPVAAWLARRRGSGADELGGLALSLDESWALHELTPERLDRAAAEGSVMSVHDAGGVRGMAFRSRTYERDPEDGPAETVVEYGLATWEGLGPGATLFDAIAADAAAVGGDRIRVAVPESATLLSEAAMFRAEPADHPEVVMAADLLGTGENPARRRRD